MNSYFPKQKKTKKLNQSHESDDGVIKKRNTKPDQPKENVQERIQKKKKKDQKKEENRKKKENNLFFVGKTWNEWERGV